MGQAVWAQNDRSRFNYFLKHFCRMHRKPSGLLKFILHSFMFIVLNLQYKSVAKPLLFGFSYQIEKWLLFTNGPGLSKVENYSSELAFPLHQSRSPAINCNNVQDVCFHFLILCLLPSSSLHCYLAFQGVYSLKQPLTSQIVAAERFCFEST